MPLELGSVPRRGIEPPLLEALYGATGNQQGVNRMLTGNDPYLAARAGMGRFALANPMQDETTPDFRWEDNDPVATALAVNSAVAQHSDPGSTVSPIMENGAPVGLRGMRNTQGAAALQDPERLSKQAAHRERVKAMQPQYASMKDRQANVTANAMQRGMGRDARMMGGYGPAIGTQLLAQQRVQQQADPQGGGGGFDPLMSPLTALLMGGPALGAAAMQAGGDLAQMAHRAQLAMQEMQTRREITKMQGEQGLAEIQAKAEADRQKYTDPEVIRGLRIAGGESADQVDIAMGRPEAVLKSLAKSSSSFDEFFNKAKASYPTMQEDELAAVYQGATGIDPYAPGFFSTRPRPAGIALPQRTAQPKIQSLLPNVTIDTGYVPDPSHSISGAMSRGWSQQF